MYGNLPGGADVADDSPLSPEQRRALRRDLASVAARTREFLPGDFVVGSELRSGATGLEATIAVQPPVGSVVSAGYAPEEDDDVSIDDDEREDLAMGLAASAALQVKQAYPDEGSPAAQ
ncbi:DUF5811 family protein [Halapricum hydrolyticum]|uniref:DUF5811 family protein n=1 Tax=Halapricum hydrolyticum TaxID=2979991 RepID=A0AAE3LFL9_9EURY|nr:DUF5811 family protein [Halapricum hydrolyticum]MCU4718664.1 DUF5811 family protein [Halapricum hydrolyticum]MCU4727650.1 DUF5811 family protein [Halapricum hydrolyticum]